MDLDEFATLVRDTLEAVRSSLALIEEAAQADDRTEFHVLSQRYAGLVGPLRDYLAGAQMGRSLPRALARRLGEASVLLGESQSLAAALGLHPDPKELAALIQEAERAG